MSMRRLRALVAALTAGLLLAATGCSTSGEQSSSNAARQIPGNSPEEVKRWIEGAWKNWDSNRWLREAGDFFNPVVPGRWNAQAMKDARPGDKTVSQAAPTDQGATDPEPQPVRAKAVSVPYHRFAAPIGKIFFDGPGGQMVCSGTVVTDPARPGRSNLVWTAGHCVHAGRDGGWFRNIVFVPAYNDSGLGAGQFGSVRSQMVLPYGVWWADWAQTSQQWIAEGAESGGAGAPFDFAVLHVRSPGDGGLSLEETVGSALPVTFSAPEARALGSLSAKGYPAGPPFDGQLMFACDDAPGRLTVTAGEPTMYRIGCTMTGGSSGGGWLATGPDRRPALVSNTSIGPADNRWLAGPHLGSEAQQVYTAVSQKFAQAPSG